MKPFSRVTTFLKESQNEAKKVNWPSRQRTIQSTVFVIALSLAVAVFLSLFDLLFTTLLETFILR